jgi:3-dehydroquinate synthase
MSMTNNEQIEFGSILSSSFEALIDVRYEKSKKIIIVDENTHDNCLEYLLTSFDQLKDAEVMLLPAGEENKVMEVCFQVWNALSEYQIGRKDLIINLGGGLVTDMGGFMASVYKRGVDFMHIPTSLLGMVDASIGGKTGIDLGPFKNQLGTFSQAQKIYIDPIFLATLPEAELWNGYAEMLKHALIADPDHWKGLISISSPDELINLSLIQKSAEIKMSFVNQDPFEKGSRKLLNFGHTIGHAIEGFSLEKDQPIAHGHAVAIGLLLESELSFRGGHLSEANFQAIQQSIKKVFPLVSIDSDAELDELLSIMYNDKKNSEGKILGILIHKIGQCTYDYEFEEEEVRRVLKTLCN